MAVLTFSPVVLTATIRTPGGAYSPSAVRAVTGQHRQVATRTLVIDGANTTLAKVGGATWLTVPATSTDGVPFDVTIDASDLAAAGDFDETIRASAGGFDDADCVVTLAVRPEGPKP